MTEESKGNDAPEMVYDQFLAEAIMKLAGDNVRLCPFDEFISKNRKNITYDREYSLVKIMHQMVYSNNEAVASDTVKGLFVMLAHVKNAENREEILSDIYDVARTDAFSFKRIVVAEEICKWVKDISVRGNIEYYKDDLSVLADYAALMISDTDEKISVPAKTAIVTFHGLLITQRQEAKAKVFENSQKLENK